MDRLTLSRIDEELDSLEVSALCFLCGDVVNRKRLQGVVDAKGLFLRLEERGLLDTRLFLAELLRVIRRADLLRLLETDGSPSEETDAKPILSDYRATLYRIYEDMTRENLEKMKFLLSSEMGRRQIESCKTALDVFAEMERSGVLSHLHLDLLHVVLLELDQQLAGVLRQYLAGNTQRPQSALLPHVSMDHQRVGSLQSTQTAPSTRETRPGDVGRNVYSDAQSLTATPTDQEFYALTHDPRGMCVVFNNEKFPETGLNDRAGTQQDEMALFSVFSRLGFSVAVKENLTAKDMQREIKTLGERDFMDDDALVVCVLSHGGRSCVFGTDAVQVSLRELTQPFTSGRAPTLAGKPKLFFIQACQGTDYQRGSVPCPPKPRQGEGDKEDRLEEDSGRVYGETVPSEADFLLGMATVQECKSFRSTSTGSIYIQELCRQLRRSADSPDDDDILTVLTRVNREVSRGQYLFSKQMPEPKYTLTKKLVLKWV
ncbi:caspase-8 [Brachionichthys hirsutus]|uniref:caspase-8 n=1 Tax=Brachionichthys hirsutus TaxID=412623 RepID=UPI003604C390